MTVKLKLALFLLCAVLCAAQTVLPNTGMTAPAIGQSNWGPLLDTDFTILDNIMGGTVAVPAFSVTTLNVSGDITGTIGTGTPNQGHFTLLTSTAIVNANDIQSGTFTSGTANAASVGSLKLANTDTIRWRNAGDTADLALGVSGANLLQFGGQSVLVGPLPFPGPATLGGVLSHNCGATSLGSINTDGTSTCTAALGGGNGVINQQGPTAPLSGTGAAQLLYTYTLVGGTLSTTGGLDVQCNIVPSGTSASVRIFVGAIGIEATPWATGQTSGTEELSVEWLNNGATNSQWWQVQGLSGQVLPHIASGTTAIDTTANQAVACYVTQGSPGTVSGAGFIVNRITQ